MSVKVCFRCRNPVSRGVCKECLEEFESRDPANIMSPSERADEIWWVADFEGIIPERVRHQRLEELAGRQIGAAEKYDHRSITRLAEEVRESGQ